LARAQQDAVWERTCAHNKLRSLLREYYPALLAAFTNKRGGLLRPEARALLAAAPTPRAPATLSITQLAALLRRAGRHRGINTEAARIQQVLRTEYLHQLPLVEDAFGRQALALLRALDTAAANAEDLATATIEHFNTHPDAEIITSLPGLGSLTGARVLAEIGDDRSRFTDARALKAYAGAAPVTRASGKSLTVTHRKVKNQRLAAVGYVWAFSALTASSGARAHYDHRKSPATVTPPPNATCSTNSSAACTTAGTPDSTTTNKSPFPPPARTQPTRQLDKLSAWDVSSAGYHRQVKVNR
jgi:transposase